MVVGTHPVPKLIEWITRFLEQNKVMVASQIELNMLIEKARRIIKNHRFQLITMDLLQWANVMTKTKRFEGLDTPHDHLS